MSLKKELLESFTKELILNSAPRYMLEEIQAERKDKFVKEITKDLTPLIKIETKEFNQEPLEEIPSPIIKETGIIESDGIEKISPMINNPSITEIECLGPNKFLVIHKGFSKILLNITLDKYEIESILNHFSKETRIPRVGGIFKAINNNLIINAIDSDFGGPRFIISKIHPHKSQYL